MLKEYLSSQLRLATFRWWGKESREAAIVVSTTVSVAHPTYPRRN